MKTRKKGTYVVMPINEPEDCYVVMANSMQQAEKFVLDGFNEGMDPEDQVDSLDSLDVNVYRVQVYEA